MIERILVMCPTRTESLRWVEILRQQIKCARTPPSNLSAASNTSSGTPTNHPLPPPHVSLNSPPFLLLTLWIRDAIEDGRLSLVKIKDLTEQKKSKNEPNEILSPWRLRKYRNQVFFNNSDDEDGYFPDDYDVVDFDLKENFKRDALIHEENGGYIRYMSSCSDEITILLPSPVVSDASTSMSDSERSSSVKGTRQMLILNDFFFFICF